MTDVVGVGLLLKALGYGVPAALLVFSFIVLPIILRHLRNKQDKDRREHMTKWESMVAIQREAIDKQKQIVDEIIDTHDKNMAQLISSHREETDRSYRLFEQQSSALAAIAHNLSTMTQLIQNERFCPNNNRSRDDGR